MVNNAGAGQSPRKLWWRLVAILCVCFWLCVSVRGLCVCFQPGLFVCLCDCLCVVLCWWVRCVSAELLVFVPSWLFHLCVCVRVCYRKNEVTDLYHCGCLVHLSSVCSQSVPCFFFVGETFASLFFCWTDKFTFVFMFEFVVYTNVLDAFQVVCWTERKSRMFTCACVCWSGRVSCLCLVGFIIAWDRGCVCRVRWCVSGWLNALFVIIV